MFIPPPLDLQARIASYASDGHRAYPLTRERFDEIIATLRRDPRFRSVPAFDLELLLADPQRDAEKRLVRELRDRIHVDLKGRKDGAGFTTLERWLGEYDALFLRRDNADPLVVVPWRVWARMLEKIQ